MKYLIFFLTFWHLGFIIRTLVKGITEKSKIIKILTMGKKGRGLEKRKVGYLDNHRSSEIRKNCIKKDFTTKKKINYHDFWEISKGFLASSNGVRQLGNNERKIVGSKRGLKKRCGPLGKISTKPLRIHKIISRI